MNAKAILSACLDFFFEPRCFACGEIVIRNSSTCGAARCFCPICADALIPLNTPKCSVCAEPFLSAAQDHLCSTCLSHPPPFERVVATFEYGGPLAQAILRYKYAPAPFMAPELGRLMRVSTLGNVDWVLPVPLHRKRLAERGFNQATLMAKEVCRQTGGQLATHLLRRTGHQGAQVGKTKKERIKNMKRAFRVVDPRGLLAGKRVVLVDDVVTTTATARAATRELIRQGRASSVVVLCLGRAAAVS
ncbi:MAG: ComF family protein [Deltaproteobacteria bacterium]|nr:ComF family protein [Deltaproteobacteria bacterium]